MATLSKTLKAVADDNRLLIIGALLECQELCACQLTEILQVSGATSSRHLALLTNAELLHSRKEGRWVYYRLNYEKIANQELFAWIEKQHKVEKNWHKIRGKIVSISAIDREELCRNQRGKACCPSKNRG